MSRVYFHSLSGEAELHGSERAYLSSLCDRVALGFVDSHSVPKLAELLDKPIYGGHRYRNINGTPEPTEHDFKLWWQVHDDYADSQLRWRGQRLHAWHVSLNTAYLLGSEHIQLAARISAQSEIHGWVDGPNRAWLADLMQSGVDRGVYRESLTLEDSGVSIRQGWRDVLSLLRLRDDEPVVMSHSVSNSFLTNAAYATDAPHAWMDKHHKDHFEDDPPPCPQCRTDYFAELPINRRWELGMEWLKSKGTWLELTPEQFGRNAHYYFGDSVTLVDLLSPDRDTILGKVFSSTSIPAWELR